MRNILVISSLAFLLIGCGGSGTGSTTSETSVSDNAVSRDVNTEANADNATQKDDAFAYNNNAMYILM